MVDDMFFVARLILVITILEVTLVVFSYREMPTSWSFQALDRKTSTSRPEFFGT